MVLVTTSWQRWAAGLAVSLVVFVVLYLTVIQPSTNTANHAVKAGMQQTQQAIKQAQQHINRAGASNPASAASGHASKQFAAAGAKATNSSTRWGSWRRAWPRPAPTPASSRPVRSSTPPERTLAPRHSAAL